MAIFGIDRILSSTAGQIANDYTGMYWYCPRSGSATDVSFYANATAGTTTFQGMIYSRTASTTGTLLEQTGVSGSINTTPQWITLSLNASLSVTAGTIYWIILWSGNAYDMVFDAIGATGQAMNFTGATFSSPAVSFTGAVLFDSMISAYVTFTPTAEAARSSSVGLSSEVGLSSYIL